MKLRSSQMAPLALSISLSILANYPLPAAAANREPVLQNITTGINDQETVSVHGVQQRFGSG